MQKSQLVHYDILKQTEPERDLYLAVRHAIFLDLFEEPLGKLLLDNRRMKLLVFDPEQEVIIKWIS